MDDVKHTPGPWVESGETVLVRGVSWLGFANYENPTASANGRLIKAAPDMLEALKAVMAEYKEGYGLNCVDQVSAAIAKATGGV